MASLAGYSTQPKGLGLAQYEDDEDISSQCKTRAYAGLMRLLSRLGDRSPISRTLLTAFLVIDVLQLLIVPLSPSTAMPWLGQSLMGSIYKFLLYVNIVPTPGLGFAHSYPADSLTIAAIVLCAVFAGWLVYLWLAEAFGAADAPRSAWGSRLVWYLAPVLCSAIFMPMAASLIAPLSCLVSSQQPWMGTQLQCWSGGHLGLLIAGLIVLIPFVAISLLLALTLVDRRVSIGGKDNATCAVHGRVDAGMLVMRLGLAGFIVLGFDVSPWVTVLISIAAGLAWLGVYAWWLPFYRLSMNQMYGVAAGVFLSAGVAAALSVATSESSGGSGGTILFLFLILPVCYCCYSLVAFRWRSLQYLNDLSSPYLVELKARFLLVDSVEPVMKEQASARGGRSASGLGTGSGKSGGGFKSLAGRTSSRSGVSGRHDKDRDEDAMSVRSGTSDRHGASVVSKPRSGVRSSALQRTDAEDLEACAAGPGGIATIGDALRAADGIYADAARFFSGSALLDIFAAQYLGAVRNNRHLERLHLKMAASKAGSWALDVQFFAFCRQEQIIESDADASGNRMTVQRRIELEDLLELSRLQVDGTRAQVLAFWETLSQRHPELSKLQATGVEINRALQQTDSTFRRLLALAPQSATVMRAYAEFLIELANDGRKGMELLNDAEQIEDEQSRAHASSTAQDDDTVLGALTEFDLSVDSLAMIRVSAEPETVGHVTALNATAQKLLGYTTRELAGRDIATIIPEPIGGVHPMLLDQYIDDGRERMTGTSRTLFMQHRSGYVMPVRLAVAKSLTGDEWFAVAEEIRTNWSFLWFMGEEASWRLTAVCKASQALLGIDPVAVRGGGVALTSLVPDVEDMMAQFEVNADKSVLVRMALGEAADAAAAGTPGRAADRDDAVSAVSSRSRGSVGSGKGKAGGLAPHHRSDSVLVAARLQTFHIPALEAPFHILRFRKATPADQTMGALGSLPAPGPKEARKPAKAASGAAGKAASNHQPHGHVSWGRGPKQEAEVYADRRDRSRAATDVSDRASVDAADDSSARSDSPPVRGLALPPTPPASLRSGSSAGHTRRSEGMPAGHPSGGDISLCPVMGGGAAASARKRPSWGGSSPLATGASVPRHQQSLLHPVASFGGGASKRAPSHGQGQGGAYTYAALPGPGGIALPFASDAAAPPLELHVLAPATADALGLPCISAAGGGSVPQHHLEGDGCGNTPVVPLQLPNAVGGYGSASAHPFDDPSLHLLTGTYRQLASSVDLGSAMGHPIEVRDDSVGAPAAAAGAARGDGNGWGVPRASPRGIVALAAAAVTDPDDAASRVQSSFSAASAVTAPRELDGRVPSSERVATAASNTGSASTAVAVAGAGPLPHAADLESKTGPWAAGELRADDRGVALTGTTAHAGRSKSRVLTFAREHADAADAGPTRGSDAAGAEGERPVAAAAGTGAVDGGSGSPLQRAGSDQGGAMTPAKGPASVHSKGSKGSGGSGASVSDILRRGVAAKGKRLERSLVLLNRAIIVAFLLVGLMNIASLAVTSVLFGQMSDNMAIVKLNADRGLALQRIYGDVQSLQLHNAGLAVMADNGTAKLATLRANIDAFETAHLALYKQVDGQVQAETDLYVQPAIVVQDLLAGQFRDYDNYNTSTRNVNLMNGGAEIVTRARRVAASPLTSIVESNTDAFWVFMNGYRPIRAAVNTSMMLADSRSAAQTGTIEVANYAVLGVGIGILLLIGTAVITPAVFQVLGAKQAIMDVFLDVPVTVIKALKARTQKRVAAAQAEAEGDDVALDVEDDKGGGEQDDGLAAVAMAANGGMVLRTHFSTGADDNSDAGSRASGTPDRDPRALMAMPVTTTDSAAGPTKIAGKSRRRYTRVSSAQNVLMLSMLWPIVVYILYYVGTYVWKQQQVKYAEHARAEVLWSGQLQFWIRQVNFNARSALAYSAPGFVTDQVTRARLNSATGIKLMNALLYGDAGLNTRAMLQVSPDVASLWTRYACFDNGDFYYTVAECEAFHDSILSRSGLLGAAQEYFTLANTLVDWAVAHSDQSMSLNSGQPALMQQFGIKFFPPAFTRNGNIMTDEPMASIAQFNAVNIVVTVASLLALFAFYFAIYLPLVRRLDREIKQVRNLLLLFPDEVSRNCSAIILAGREFIKDSGSVAGSGSIASGAIGRRSGRRGF